jgi:hypothetical protein
MNRHHIIMNTLAALLMGTAIQTADAQSVNLWRGDANGAEWTSQYKWKLNHPPMDNEAAHFRVDNSTVIVNSTVQLNNGMHLYGQELLLKGNGNINMWSMVPHERTVNIPASGSGFANLTLSDNLSLNGRISLSAKGFGTSASKGTVTLKNRSTVTGDLAIGNDGNGTGQVYVKDNSTFRITGLKLETKAEIGGMAEIHIMGGTVRIETEDNPFDIFLADPSRKIIIGDRGTLRIESDLPIAEKKDLIKQMIENNRLVAESGCHLTLPIFQNEMLIARAESRLGSSKEINQEELLAAIDAIDEKASILVDDTTVDLGALVQAIQREKTNKTETLAQSTESAEKPLRHTAGYIVFFGTVLLALRRTPPEE